MKITPDRFVAFEGRAELPLETLQALALEIFHGHTVLASRPVLKSASTAVPISYIYPDPWQPPADYHAPQYVKGPQPVKPEFQVKTRRAGWLGGWL